MILRKFGGGVEGGGGGRQTREKDPRVGSSSSLHGQQPSEWGRGRGGLGGELRPLTSLTLKKMPFVETFYVVFQLLLSVGTVLHLRVADTRKAHFWYTCSVSFYILQSTECRTLTTDLLVAARHPYLCILDRGVGYLCSMERYDHALHHPFHVPLSDRSSSWMINIPADLARLKHFTAMVKSARKNMSSKS